LRRASKRFWLLVSVAAVVAALAIQRGSGAGGMKRVNELTLAGARPGRDHIQDAERANREYVHSYRREIDDRSSSRAILRGESVWSDICHLERLTMSVGADGIIRSIEISRIPGAIDADCETNLKPNPWGTGRGLSFRDQCTRIEEIYGKAESRSPSVKGSDKLELYLYTFDWAGPDVPQVMEVSCDVSSQTVAEITLAASSL
jgi:hypothetical protein